jgi:hypothetical protein
MSFNIVFKDTDLKKTISICIICKRKKVYKFYLNQK